MSCIKTSKVNYYMISIHVLLIAVIYMYINMLYSGNEICRINNGRIKLEKQLSYEWGYKNGLYKVMNML